jgi:hypothetical protein
MTLPASILSQIASYSHGERYAQGKTTYYALIITKDRQSVIIDGDNTKEVVKRVGEYLNDLKQDL